LTQIFLAMMWRSADGGLTIAFWWAAALSTAGIAAGIWGLVAPESCAFTTSAPSIRGEASPAGACWRRPSMGLVIRPADSRHKCARHRIGHCIHDLDTLFHYAGRRLL